MCLIWGEIAPETHPVCCQLFKPDLRTREIDISHLASGRSEQQDVTLTVKYCVGEAVLWMSVYNALDKGPTRPPQKKT